MVVAALLPLFLLTLAVGYYTLPPSIIQPVQSVHLARRVEDEPEAQVQRRLRPNVPNPDRAERDDNPSGSAGQAPQIAGGVAPDTSNVFGAESADQNQNVQVTVGIGRIHKNGDRSSANEGRTSEEKKAEGKGVYYEGAGQGANGDELQVSLKGSDADSMPYVRDKRRTNPARGREASGHEPTEGPGHIAGEPNSTGDREAVDSEAQRQDLHISGG